MNYESIEDMIKMCDDMAVEAEVNRKHAFTKHKKNHYELIRDRYTAFSKYLNELRRFRTIYKTKLS